MSISHQHVYSMAIRTAPEWNEFKKHKKKWGEWKNNLAFLNSHVSMKEKKVLSFDGLKNILMVFNPLEKFMLERPKKMFLQCSPTAQNICVYTSNWGECND